MQKRNTIFSILQTSILCGLVWICFVFAHTAFNHPTDQQEIFAPESASSILTIKGDTLLTQSFMSLIFNRDDEEQVRLIATLKEKIKSIETDQKWNFGIDLVNDIQLFTHQINHKDLKGFIFRLNDTKLWDENGSNLLSGNVYTQRKGSTGIILHSATATVDELSHYYKKHSVAEKKSKISNEIITYQYQSENNSSIKNVQANFIFESKQILINFSGELNKEIISGKRKFELDHGGLHIQSSYIPNAISDTLNYFSKKHNLSLPKIRSIDLKYDGIELASSYLGILPLPTIEAIFEFEHNFAILDFIQKIASNEPKVVQIEGNSFIIAEKTYFFKQLDSKTIYIGSTKKPKIITPKKHDFISISGDPKMLSNIQGNRFVTGLVKMNDDFKKVEGILNRLENIEFQIDRKNDTQLVGSGKLTLLDKRTTMNELLKTILSLI